MRQGDRAMRRAMILSTIAGIFVMPCLSQAQPEESREQARDWYENGWTYSQRIAVTVRNTTSRERPDEPVVLRVGDLQEEAEDFNPHCFVVVDPAAESDHDKESGGNDVPSQADDLDGDGQVDEIAFEVGLGPRESKRVFLYYEPGDASRPLDYVPQTHAFLSPRYEGPGWESNIIAYRLYLDARNAVDVFGKVEPMLSLSTFATPGHDYHQLSDAGMDVLHIGEALGAGGFALWRDGELLKPEECGRSARIVARGPVRAIVEVVYRRWAAGVGGREADVTARFTIWANHRWTEQRVVVEGLRDFRAATGLPKTELPAGRQLRPLRGKGYLGTWGAQSDLNDDLGLGVVYRTSDLAGVTEDDFNHLVLFKGIGTKPIVWWLVAAWEQETDGITTPAGFASMLQGLEGRLTERVEIAIERPE